MNNLLIGGPIVAGVVAFWSQIKGVINKLRSMVVLRVCVRGDLSNALAYYCWETMRRVRIGDRKYQGRNAFVRSSDRYQQVAYEIIGKSGVLFLKGFKPLLVGQGGEVDGEGHTYDGDLTFSIIRGTWDIDKLISEALDLYNKHNISGFQSKRFYVVRKYGSIGANIGIGQKNEETAQPADAESRIELWDKRLVGIDPNDVGQKVHESGEPFESLSFPTEIWDAIDDIKCWKNSEAWYKEKHIPWKRGWLLCGPPGTGKTSLVRAVGEYLDMPVISFSLSSFTDREFQRTWDDLRSFVPCIALIEDIDTVFHGRENITRGGDLSKPINFDTLLNSIDGVASSDGILAIITTNKPEYLDEALGSISDGKHYTRPGRIDRILELKPLDKECRTNVARRILSDCPHLIDNVVEEGDGDTGAQFQDRCSKIALREFWDSKEDAEMVRKTVKIDTLIEEHSAR